MRSTKNHVGSRLSLQKHRKGFAIIGSLVEVSLIGLVVWFALTVIPLLSHSGHLSSSVDADNGGELIFRLSLTSEGRQLAIHRSSAEIVAFDLATHRIHSVCRPNHCPISRSYLTDDGTIYLQSFEDREFVIFKDGDVVIAEQLINVPHPIVTLSSDGHVAVLVFGGTTVRWWNLSCRDPESQEFRLIAPAQRIAVDAQGTKLVVHTQQGSIDLYDLKTGNLLGSLAGSEPPTGDPIFSRDGCRLVAICGASLDCYELVSVQKEWTVRIPEPDSFRNATFSPDGQQIAACSLLAGVHVIDRVDGEQRCRKLPGTVMHKVAFSSSSDILYSGRTDGSIRVWSTSTGREIDRIDVRQKAWSDGR